MNPLSEIKRIWKIRQHYFEVYGSGDLVTIRRQLAVRRWRLDRGDETRRLDYPLNSESIVFDLGGYKGDFAAEIVKNFNCRVYLFEPVAAYAQICRERFQSNPKVQTFAFGLGATDATFAITLEENASSIAKITGTNAPTETATVREFGAFCRDHQIDHIDLIKINIEGSEYDVLENLIATGFIRNIDHLQIQFHTFAPDAKARRERIRAALRQTHRESWNYYFVWESWHR